MKYRIVEREDGLFQAQCRVMFFWWANSMLRPSADLEIIQASVKSWAKPKIIRVIT